MNMTSSIRKFALTTHVSSSVGLLGSIAAFLVLAISGLNNQDMQAIRAAYIEMDLLAKFIIVPLAFASLATARSVGVKSCIIATPKRDHPSACRTA